jgi:hypothetical protein
MIDLSIGLYICERYGHTGNERESNFEFCVFEIIQKGICNKGGSMWKIIVVMTHFTHESERMSVNRKLFFLHSFDLPSLIVPFWSAKDLDDSTTNHRQPPPTNHTNMA